MGIQYILDTDVSSYLIKGKSPRLEAKVISLLPDNVFISVITRAELLYGLKRLPENHRLQVAVSKFLKAIRIASWDDAAADYYADICHQLTTEGKPIGHMDMMIASHAVSNEAVLITNNNRHFERIKAPLLMEDWSELF